MTSAVWILWFVITLVEPDQKLHIPVEGSYPTEADCTAEIPKWETLLHEQFPDDQNTRVYCEALRKESQI